MCKASGRKTELCCPTVWVMFFFEAGRHAGRQAQVSRGEGTWFKFGLRYNHHDKKDALSRAVRCVQEVKEWEKLGTPKRRKR